MNKISRLIISAVLVLELCGCGALAPKDSQDAVNQLCTHFNGQPHKKLLTPNEKKAIDKLRNGGGIPIGLKNAVGDYYTNEELNGGTIDTFDNVRRQRLDAKLNKVISECHSAGWAN